MLKIYVYWHKCSCHGCDNGQRKCEDRARIRRIRIIKKSKMWFTFNRLDCFAVWWPFLFKDDVTRNKAYWEVLLLIHIFLQWVLNLCVSYYFNFYFHFYYHFYFEDTKVIGNRTFCLETTCNLYCSTNSNTNKIKYNKNASSRIRSEACRVREGIRAVLSECRTVEPCGVLLDTLVWTRMGSRFQGKTISFVAPDWRGFMKLGLILGHDFPCCSSLFLNIYHGLCHLVSLRNFE